MARRLSWTVLALCAIVGVHIGRADTLIQNWAEQFDPRVAPLQERLLKIKGELKHLPQPYGGEPTGTAGYLSKGEKGYRQVEIVFRWDEPVNVDALALFPLRLYTDVSLMENLGWPKHVEVEASLGGVVVKTMTVETVQTEIRQSLPELIVFPSILVDNLKFTAINPNNDIGRIGASIGFAEICVFSGNQNVAPRSTVQVEDRRNRYPKLSKHYLIDGHTSLGLQEFQTGRRSFRQNGWVMPSMNLDEPFSITLDFGGGIWVDTLRVDPALGNQSEAYFPVRFALELLDEHGNVIRSDRRFQNFAFRNPGRNAHYSYFLPTLARQARLQVYECVLPFHKNTPRINFSEISALYQGQFIRDQLSFQLVLPSGAEQSKRSKSYITDGETASGNVMGFRSWTESLARRQELLEEQFLLRGQISKVVTQFSIFVWCGVASMVLLIIATATLVVVKAKRRARHQIQMDRERVAGELHDEVGSSLGTIALKTDLLKNRTTGHREAFDDIQRLIRECADGMREVLHAAAPSFAPRQSMVKVMERWCGDLLVNVQHQFVADPGVDERLDQLETRKVLMLFFKEALYNAQRHARAQRVDVQLSTFGAGGIQLRIRDDGCGLSEDLLEKPQTLRSLKQRAQQLKGHFTVSSQPGQGTEVILQI